MESYVLKGEDMRIRVRRIVGTISTTILAATLGAAGLLAQKQASIIRVEPKPERLAKPTAAELAKAPRWLRSLGCMHCHGNELHGRLIFDDPQIARTYAPNLTLIAAEASDQELAQAIRQGIGHDGRAMIVMRSAEYSRLTDGETAALIAAIRSVPRGGEQTPPSAIGPIAHVALASGKMQTQPARVAAYARSAPPELGVKVSAGRHLAMTHCSECHGADLTGGEPEPGATAPDLVVASAYDLQAFSKLLRTGTPLGERKLKQMDVVAQAELSSLTGQEISSIYGYLVKRARHSH